MSDPVEVVRHTPKDTRLVRQQTITLSFEGKVAVAWALACDGSIAVHCIRNRQGRGLPSFLPLIVVSSTDKELVEGVRDYIKFGYIYCVTDTKRKNYRDYWRWTVTRTDEILQILEQIRQFLPIKQRQAELVIELCKTRLNHYIGWKPRRLWGSAREGYDRECQIYEEVTTLNRNHKTVGRGW